MSEVSDLQDKLDRSEAKDRFNNWVAISVAIISVFMAITKVKDDNIVQAMLQAKGYQIAPFICYEVVYPEFAAGLSARSDLLLTISNDTWFGRSIGPLQHLQMAQMRALEAGRWMIRATNNGVTGLINPYGQITVQIPQFERGILYGEVVPMHNLTPYLEWRSWPLIILCLGLFGWALLAGRMSKTV